MTNSYNVRDADLSATKALPAGATSSTTDAIHIHSGSGNPFLAPCELRLSIPEVSLSQVPDTKTLTFVIEHCDTVGGSYETIGGPVVQTGADGGSQAATELRVKPPSGVKQYVRGKATGSSTVAATDASMVLDLLF